MSRSFSIGRNRESGGTIDVALQRSRDQQADQQELQQASQSSGELDSCVELCVDCHQLCPLPYFPAPTSTTSRPTAYGQAADKLPSTLSYVHIECAADSPYKILEVTTRLRRWLADEVTFQRKVTLRIRRKPCCESDAIDCARLFTT